MEKLKIFIFNFKKIFIKKKNNNFNYLTFNNSLNKKEIKKSNIKK